MGAPLKIAGRWELLNGRWLKFARADRDFDTVNWRNFGG